MLLHIIHDLLVLEVSNWYGSFSAQVPYKPDRALLATPLTGAGSDLTEEELLIEGFTSLILFHFKRALVVG